MSVRAFLDPALLGMGLHVASARVRRAIRGHPRVRGTAEEILRAGLEGCWSGEYLTASPGHYRQFWTRDTGFAAPSLARLGGPWPERLLSSLAWAMRVWVERRSHVTTTINPLLRGPVDIFDFGVDSLPLLLASLQALAIGTDRDVAARAGALVERYRAWLAAEVEHYVGRVVDPSTGLVRSDRAFSAHRDTFRNSSTAYANTMVALLARTVAETGWGPELLSPYFRAAGGSQHADSFVFANQGREVPSPQVMPVMGIRGGQRIRASERQTSPAPVTDTAPAPIPAVRMHTTRIAAGNERSAADSAHTKRPPEGDTRRPDEDSHDWGSLLRRHFWLGDRFRDRLGSDETSGEANVWPFHTGLVDDRQMLQAALATLRREGYATPYPLRFEAVHRTDGLLLAFRLWSSDYQTTAAWTSLGSIYLSLLRQSDPEVAAAELDRMRRLIERDGAFWEVLDRRGRPWRSRSGLSVSDYSMLWGAILLEAFEAAAHSGQWASAGAHRTFVLR